MQTHEDLQSRLEVTERQLAGEPQSPVLLFRKGCLLEKVGRVQEAEETYRDLLEHDPAHRKVLNEFGNLLFARGRTVEAHSLYERAVAFYPDDPMSLVNLGNLKLKANDLPGARNLYERALKANPDYRLAHGGMSFVLHGQGDLAQAAIHRAAAFQGNWVVSLPYRGVHQPITVLELVSTVGGNVRTVEFLTDRVFKRFLVATEFYNAATTVLPPHDLVFNSVGDADSASVGLDMAKLVIERTRAPIINSPVAVQSTGRCAVAERLARVPNVITPKTVMLPRELLTGPNSEAALGSRGFDFPLLLRSPGFHGGEHFLKIGSAAELNSALVDLPGEQLIVIQYLDARRADGKTRKYRVMLVNGELYPLHVAISKNWKVHYFSADMTDHAEHRAEDHAFLKNMACVVGPRAIAALKLIQQTLGLDYGGIDFGLNESGDILLFEANATMAVLMPDKGEQWDYRRSAVETIYKAVWTMLMQRAPSAKKTTA
jgi:glutathione synthase/RimK-type ligase-like ATP-grasp enzyme